MTGRDLEAVLARARAAGIVAAIATGSSVRVSRSASELSARFPGRVYFTSGIHPHDAKHADGAALAEIEALAQLPGCVALGECGLDFNRNFSTPEDQERAFDAQVALACRLRKPLFMHCRDAGPRFCEILQKHHGSAPGGLPGGVVHCFTGVGSELDTYLALGLHVGITGWVCDEREGRGAALAALAARVPADRLLLETDGPYLVPRTITPSKARPRRNEPALLPYVLDAVARARGEDPGEVAAFTTANAVRLFGLEGPLPRG